MLDFTVKTESVTRTLCSGRKERNVLFNDAANTFYGYMASDIQ